MSDHLQPKISAPVATVERIEVLASNEMNDLCDATDAAIDGGGGFGWLKKPNRDILERYWTGVMTMPARILLVARLDGVICGTCQLWKPPMNNEAQRHIVTLTTNFVAPWARGHGLAHMLVEKAEEVARAEGFAVINLEVRETMKRAIEIYESMGYERFGVHPYSVKTDNELLKGYYYCKVVNPEALGLEA